MHATDMICLNFWQTLKAFCPLMLMNPGLQFILSGYISLYSVIYVNLNPGIQFTLRLAIFLYNQLYKLI